MPSPWPGCIALAHSPASGSPTVGMRPYGSWCGPVRPRWRTCARSASICNPFCCAMDGSIPAPGPGPRSMPDGSPTLSFEHPAPYLVLREYRQAIDDAEARLERLTQQVAEVVGSWSMAPVVEAYQSMRGVAFLTAVTFVAEIGDVRRFETPRQLMAYLGLVPSERSTGEQVWRGSITKGGNPRARRVLVEGAWTYRYPARLSRALQVRQESLPTVVRAIAWKAQRRLCARYRRLMAAGKRQTVVTTAIAREMAAFLWAIGHAVEPRPAA